jgi:hypothetical protein
MHKLTIAALVLSLSVSANSQSLRADHPIIGSWKITLPDNSCYEVYRIRANGTTFVTSAEDVGESEFTISDQPSSKGFYKWVDKIVKDNGKKDCVGETMVIGDVATKYIRFNPGGNMFLMCDAEDLKTCIGPFVRMKGDDA